MNYSAISFSRTYQFLTPSSLEVNKKGESYKRAGIHYSMSASVSPDFGLLMKLSTILMVHLLIFINKG